MAENPWIKFYPRDWRGDQALRAVSIAARGLWMEMLCIMHEASPYGHLVLGDRAVSDDVLARMAGAGMDEVSALLIELENAGVLSRTRRGVIYSRRLVKDKTRSEKGRKAVSKRYAQATGNERKSSKASRSPSRNPTTQKPEARSQSIPPSPQGDEGTGFKVPAWVPEGPWASFETMRKRIKHPLDDNARSLAVKALDRLRRDGNDPAEVLEQSALNDWRGLFEVRAAQGQRRSGDPADYLDHVITKRRNGGAR